MISIGFSVSVMLFFSYKEEYKLSLTANFCLTSYSCCSENIYFGLKVSSLMDMFLYTVIEKEKTLPCFEVDSSQISPPRALQIYLQMFSPKLFLSGFSCLFFLIFDFENCSKRFSASCLSIPIPLSLTFTSNL